MFVVTYRLRNTILYVVAFKNQIKLHIIVSSLSILINLFELRMFIVTP